MILLDALYINNSGGKALLDFLINNLLKHQINVFYLLDKRYKPETDKLPHAQTHYMKPSFLKKYNFYKKNKNKFSKIFCFGNIPPPLKTKAKVYTYFHNTLLLETPKNYPFNDKLIKNVKANMIRYLKSNTDYFIVQTENTKKILVSKLKFEPSKCLVIPFFDPNRITRDPIIKKKRNMYLYVSDGNSHKNHKNLLKAWQIVNQSHPEYELHLTISDNYPHIQNRILNLQKMRVPIINHRNLDFESLYNLYNQAEYFLYPSLTESFGLGLIEAADVHCKIIASDLPYVHSVVKPLVVFNPYKPLDIANTILHFKKKGSKTTNGKKIKNQIDDILKIFTSQ